MASTCKLADFIKRSDLNREVMYRSGDTNDIVKVIAHADKQSLSWVNQEQVQCLLADTEYETLRNVWSVVKRNLRYRADLPGHEIVKSPGALVTIGQGDCKSFSVLIGAILKALGFQYRYRFTAYERGSDVTHVYVVTKVGGREVILDAVHTRFDEQVPYLRKVDYAPASSTAGVRGTWGVEFAEGGKTLLYLGLIGLGLWAFNK